MCESSNSVERILQTFTDRRSKKTQTKNIMQQYKYKDFEDLFVFIPVAMLNMYKFVQHIQLSYQQT